MLEREWAARRRPRPLTGRFYCHVALLVDSTTILINKPLGRFSESKIFFDGKNHVYGIKKEVAVWPHPPLRHVREQGRTRKSPRLRDSERRLPPVLGVPNEDPGRRGTFHRQQLPPVVRAIRQRIPRSTVGYPRAPKDVRPTSECFPCRRSCSDGAREAYRWSPEYFDMDVNNCVWLTNEHIRSAQLTQLDHDLYGVHLKHRAWLEEEKARTRRRQYNIRKKLRQEVLERSFLCDNFNYKSFI